MQAADRDIIAAMAAETADVRDQLDDLAGLVADLVRALPEGDRVSALTRAQSMDALGQRLDALSGLLQVVAGGACLRTAITGLPLSDMARRLGRAGADADVLAMTPVAASGDLILFD